MYQRFPILGQRRHLPAAQLSGGEQQILVIARGLLARPQLLLLDEPSLGLAPQLVREVMRLVKHIREEGTTVLLVEQNARQALALADHAYVLEQGRISLEGSGRALLADPAVIKAYLGVAPAMQVARHSES
jgi:branched-chain amino acid transport system ATP-binding protein